MRCSPRGSGSLVWIIQPCAALPSSLQSCVPCPARGPSSFSYVHFVSLFFSFCRGNYTMPIPLDRDHRWLASWCRPTSIDRRCRSRQERPNRSWKSNRVDEAVEEEAAKQTATTTALPFHLAKPKQIASDHSHGHLSKLPHCCTWDCKTKKPKAPCNSPLLAATETQLASHWWGVFSAIGIFPETHQPSSNLGWTSNQICSG